MFGRDEKRANEALDLFGLLLTFFGAQCHGGRVSPTVSPFRENSRNNEARSAQWGLEAVSPTDED